MMTAQPVKIFISGYPQDMDEMALVQLVSPYGQVSTIKIVRDKKSGKAKGYAFIEMASRAAAEDAAIALGGIEMKGKILTVNIVEDTPVPSAQTYKKVERQAGSAKPKRPRLQR